MMMTAREAFEIVKNDQPYVLCNDTCGGVCEKCNHREAFEMAINALEKQIDKITLEGPYVEICPVCGFSVKKYDCIICEPDIAVSAVKSFVLITNSKKS